MGISINNVNGVIEIFTDSNMPQQLPRCYYGGGGTSGKFYPLSKSLKYIIEIGGDFYEIYWSDLSIGNIQPNTFLDAGRLLGQIFTNGTTTYPSPPPPTTLKINQSINFDIDENEDFTIEWFMNMSSDAYFPRAYSIGAYPSASNAVSIEGGNLIWWANSSYVIGVQLPNYLYNWHHIAIVRNNGNVVVYFDGMEISDSMEYTNAIPGANDLYLGSENAENTYLDGKMSNFRWTKGLAVYTNNFTPSKTPLIALEGTKLLILQGDSLELEHTDNSGFDNTITNTNTTYSIDNPFSGYTGSTLFGNF